MVLKQNWGRAHWSEAWERAGRAAWRKCRPSSSPSTPESESAFYQAGPPAAPGGLCQVTWCLTLVVGQLLTHLALWLNSFTNTSPFNPETRLLKKGSYYWSIERCPEKTVSGSVFPKGEIGKLRPSLCRSGVAKHSSLQLLVWAHLRFLWARLLEEDSRAGSSQQWKAGPSSFTVQLWLVWMASGESHLWLRSGSVGRGPSSYLQAGFLESLLQRKFRGIKKRTSLELLSQNRLCVCVCVHMDTSLCMSCVSVQVHVCVYMHTSVYYFNFFDCNR